MNKKIIILILIIASLGVLYRYKMGRLPAEFDDVNVFYGPDSYQHMRRAEWISENYPKIPYNDPYVYHPDKGPIHWPPAYDFLLASVWKLLRWSGLSTHTAEQLLNLTNPIIAFFIILLVFLITNRLFGTLQGVIATLVIALAPVHMNYSRFGNIDHHAIISLLVLIVSWLLYRSFEKDASRSLKWFTGFFIAFTQLIHPSLCNANLILIAIMVGAFLYNRLSPKILPMNSIYSTFNEVFLSGSIFSFLCSLTTPHGRSFQVVFESLSFFHVLIPFVGFTITRVCIAFESWKNRQSSLFSLSIPLFCILTISIFLGFSNAISTLYGGLHYVAGEDIYIIFPAEAKTLYSFGLDFNLKMFSGYLFLAPIFFILFFLKHIKTIEKDFHVIVFLIYGAIISSMGFIQYVFSPNLMIFISVFSGALTVVIANTILQRIPFVHRIIPNAINKKYLLAVLLFLLVFSFTIYELILNYGKLIETDLVAVQGDRMCRYIRDVTPPTKGFFTENEKAEYSIFTNRDLAHMINYRARRATIVNPMAAMSYFRDHVRDFSRFMLSTGITKPLNILKKYNSLYVINSPISPIQSGFYARIIDQPLYELYSPSPNGIVYKDLFYELMNTRLYLFNGSSFTRKGKIYRAVSFLRLLYETQPHYQFKEGEYYPLYSFYQVVKGALITGHAKPGSMVSASIELESNTKRRFTYSVIERADKQGKWSLRFPYPSELVKKIKVIPLGNVHVMINKTMKKVDILERDVLEGNIISIL